ncbi:hypothetical protein Patl1_21537 [Pistacia atlantica]|uniref:Uncharacterized protein n=1 Tax=Pistacia atlantica TaxID=434234 RepID=A0ACC1BMJ0_9ROSI|nr:hypothetical protein Patl1_21537 [Pistacia atlantica]
MASDNGNHIVIMLMSLKLGLENLHVMMLRIFSQFVLQAVDDAGHDKASVFKVKALEAVDQAIVEYGDHSFEPVPFTMCRLKDFVGAVGGESTVMKTSLDPFPLPAFMAGEDLTEDSKTEKERSSHQLQAFSGDSVCEFSEIAAARGCLGRFPGGEMLGIIKNYLKLSA